MEEFPELNDSFDRLASKDPESISSSQFGPRSIVSSKPISVDSTDGFSTAFESVTFWLKKRERKET